MRLTNRFRKTGTYIRPDNAFLLEMAGADQMRSAFMPSAPEDEVPDYGAEEYEGGELEVVDPEAE